MIKTQHVSYSLALRGDQFLFVGCRDRAIDANSIVKIDNAVLGEGKDSTVDYLDARRVDFLPNVCFLWQHTAFSDMSNSDILVKDALFLEKVIVLSEQ